MSFDLGMDVTDAFGYTGTGKAEIINAPNVMPAALLSGPGAPVVTRPGGYDRKLQLTFNVPVSAAPSWKDPAPAGY